MNEDIEVNILIRKGVRLMLRLCHIFIINLYILCHIYVLCYIFLKMSIVLISDFVTVIIYVNDCLKNYN